MAMLNNDTLVETTMQFSLGWIHQVSRSPSFQRPTFPCLLFGRANCPRQLRKVVLVASINHPFWGRWATHFSTHNPLSDSSHLETCGSTPHHPKLPGGFAESSLPGPMLCCWVFSYPKRIHEVLLENPKMVETTTVHNQALAVLVYTMNINSYWFRFWNVLETTAVKFNCLELFSDFHVCCRHFESSGISVSHLFFPNPKNFYRCTMSFYVWIHLAWPNFTAQHQKTSEHNWNHILKVVFTPIFHWKLSVSPSPLPSPATEQHPDSAWCAGAAPVRRWRSENQPVQRCGKWFTRTMKIRWMEAILNQLVSIGNYLFSVNKWGYNGKNHLPTGAGFLQSTVSWILWEHNGNVMFNQQPTM